MHKHTGFIPDFPIGRAEDNRNVDAIGGIQGKVSRWKRMRGACPTKFPNLKMLLTYPIPDCRSALNTLRPVSDLSV